MYILAIDFGTANTYLSRCDSANGSPQNVQVIAGEAGIDTAVLFRPDQPDLIGKRAVNTFFNARAEERASWNLRTQFKPDIATSDSARNAARAFLATLLTDAQSSGLHLNPRDGRTRVIFGVPSEAPAAYKEVLRETARDAGFGSIEVTPEPVGALIYHVNTGQLPMQTALQGGLVIDFGGGTCDFAFVKKGSVLHSWGDLELGGRLFDDLFYQWFVDQNPGIDERMAADGLTYYVHAHECREVKERFSQAMDGDRGGSFRRAMNPDGRLTGLTWEGFVNRARYFRPSAFLCAERQSSGVPLGRLGQGGSIDLIEWFERALTDGLSNAGVQFGEVKFVLLSGGSSLWPFVRDVVQGKLEIGAGAVFRSGSPYEAISQGLAVLPALTSKFEETRLRLQRGLGEFLAKRLEPTLTESLEVAVSRLSEELTERVFDAVIEPELDRFRNEGGTIKDFEERLETAAQAVNPALASWLSEKTQARLKAVARVALDDAQAWLKEHGITPSDSDPAISQRPRGIDTTPRAAVLEPAYAAFAAAVTLIVSSITASLAGGTGIALVASGPIGWVVGALLGLVAAILAIRYGTKRGTEMAKTWSVPAWAARRLMSPARIQRLRRETRRGFRKQVGAVVRAEKTGILGATSKLIHDEIGALSVFQALGNPQR